MNTMTAKGSDAYARLVAAGEMGLTLSELPIRHGWNPVPTLIFAKLVEHVSGSKPARYRAVSNAPAKPSFAAAPALRS
jgi:hypothetical protein